MLETESELAKLGVPVKTRHNEVAPNQYEIAPVFEGTNVGCDHQMLTMQMMQNVARRYGLVCLLHEKPFAGVNGSGKHNNWSMGTDTGTTCSSPATRRTRTSSSCSSRRRDPGRRHPPAAAARVDREPGQDHRLGANEAPPAIISIFLGAELEEIFGAIAEGKASASKPGSFLGLGTPVLPPLPLHSGDRNRTSPFAFTGNKFEFRALGSSLSPACPTRCSTRSSPRRSTTSPTSSTAALKGGASLEKALSKVVKESYARQQPIVFNGDNYSEAWHDEAEKRGLDNLRSTPDALPWLVDARRRAVQALQGAVQARARVPLRGVHRAVLDEDQHRGRDGRLDRPHAAAAGGAAPPDRAAARLEPLVGEVEALVGAPSTLAQAREGQRAAPPDVGGTWARLHARRGAAAMDGVRAIADRLERIVADDLWPLPKYSEMLFIK